jgi:hypothetical protein
MSALAVLGAWDKLMQLLRWVAALPWRIARRAHHVVTCGEPLGWQLAEAIDNLGLKVARPWSVDPLRYPRLFTAGNVTLTTWLGHPSWAIDSYRRHIAELRENEDWLRAHATVRAA